MTKSKNETGPVHPHAPPAQSTDRFSDRIRILTDTCGGASHIARTCGFSEGVVRSWRDGRSDPSRERCVALARGLGISLMWLVAGEGAMRDNIAPHPAPHGEATTITDTDEVDKRRLSSAMRMLESTLDATDSPRLPVEVHVDMLAEYYAVLGNTDPVARAEGLLEVQRHLVDRLKQGKLA